MDSTPKKRGRPREFDTTRALLRARDTFLRFGYAGASIEELARAMELSKPSLYAAFGDKRSLYLRVLDERGRELGARFRAAFEKEKTLEAAVRAMLLAAVDAYLDDAEWPGCLLASAATTEAPSDETIAEYARRFFAVSDVRIASWILEKIPVCDRDAAPALARLLNGVIHDLALRARIGEPRTKLREIARDTARTVARFDSR
ncbi:MAG TPA: TetR/AcrR family transcriptional regulator [Polyangiaceae bacterium]|nr:TetR/AcrR family transcriptional regulator [Polyangiaceae bacterium]